MKRFAAASLVAVMAAGLQACSSSVPDSRDTENRQQEVESAEAEASPAPGPQEPGSRRHRRGPPSPERLLERFDRNGNGVVEREEVPPFLHAADKNNDGQITVEELRAHHEQMRAEHFARKDENGDGFLTRDEIGERRWEKISVADADGDGKLSRAELDEAHAGGKLAKGMRRHKRMRPERLVEKLDQNRNGALELDEIPEHKREHLVRADANGDKTLSKEELEAFFRSHHGKRFGGPPPAPAPR